MQKQMHICKVSVVAMLSVWCLMGSGASHAEDFDRNPVAGHRGLASSPPAQTLDTIYNFRNGAYDDSYDGNYPMGGLIADAQGALYGTTYEGGFGYGAVFKLTALDTGRTAWTETTLYRFSGGGNNVYDGAYPMGGLIIDSQGALYGTTYESGDSNYGTVFRLTPPRTGPDWTLTVLHSFSGIDGAYPEAGLIADKHGVLYGTTYEGGDNNYGAVFKLTPPAPNGTAWTETVLYSFCSQDYCHDGSYPVASLILDGESVLYGTTEYGGSTEFNASNRGVVFKLTRTATAWTESVIHIFLDGPDGAYPTAGLIIQPGALYGTTSYGGDVGAYGGNLGTVFKLTPPTFDGGPWAETVLPFGDSSSSGYFPMAGLIAYEGALYGTTVYGGSGDCEPSNVLHDHCGTVFKLNLSPP
jgi:uncharacterized repeat protein (TIGR03803 family)